MSLSQIDRFSLFSCADLLFPVGEKYKYMAGLAAYFDDSGNSKIAVVAGGIASIPQWLKLRKEWTKTIIPWNLKHGYFHTTDCVSGQEDYATWTDSLKEQRVLQLVRITKKHIRFLLAHAVRKDEFDRAFAIHPNKHHKTPIRFCAYMMCPAVGQWRNKSSRRPAVALFFESGNRLMGEYGRLINTLGGFESFQEKSGICSMSLVNKDDPAAQVADLIAYAVFVCERNNPIPDWLARCLKELFTIKHDGLSFSYEQLELYFKNYALLQSEGAHGANKKVKGTQGIEKENASLVAGCIPQPIKSSS